MHSVCICMCVCVFFPYLNHLRITYRRLTSTIISLIVCYLHIQHVTQLNVDQLNKFLFFKKIIIYILVALGLRCCSEDFLGAVGRG